MQIIDPLVIKYRQGGCFALAEALRRLTGLPVRCIDHGPFVHAFVQTEQGDVIDIHGRSPWPDFLTLLVATGAIPEVQMDYVRAEPISPEKERIWNTLARRGYRKPSETAVRQAIRDAKRHPATAAAILAIKHLASPTAVTQKQCA